jgi:hypothetical protein
VQKVAFGFRRYVSGEFQSPENLGFSVLCASCGHTECAGVTKSAKKFLMYANKIEKKMETFYVNTVIIHKNPLFKTPL